MLPAGRLSVSALAAPGPGGCGRTWPPRSTSRCARAEPPAVVHRRVGPGAARPDGRRVVAVRRGRRPPVDAVRRRDGPDRLRARARRRPAGDAPRHGGRARTFPYPVRTVLSAHGPRAPLSTRADRDAGPGAVPRAPAERAPSRTHARQATAPPARPAALVDAPTTITVVPDGLDTVPHGIPRRVPEPVADAERSDAGRRTRGPAVRGRDAAAEEDPAVSPGAPEGEAQTEVTRTASRGLFRRRPDRPARPARGHRSGASRS